MRIPESAARAGVAGIICLALTLAVMHAVQPGLDPTRHFVSEYAYGSFGIWLQIGYVIAGAAVILIAWSVGGWLSATRWSVVVVTSLLLIGIGLAATGLTRIDLPADAGATSTSGTVHELAGYLAIVGLLVGAFSLPAALARGGHGELSVPARRYAWIVAVAVVAVIVLQRVELAGIGQRIFLAVAMGWLVWVGIQAGRPDERAALTQGREAAVER